MESHPWARSVTGIPDGPGFLRMSRLDRERATQRARYIVDMQTSEGDGNSTTVRATAVTSSLALTALSDL